MLKLIEYPRSPVPYAVLEGRLPTRREIEDIKSRGLGMHWMSVPDENLDLVFLQEYSSFLQYLSISDGRCRDVRPVTELGLLRGLSLEVDQRVDVDLTVLDYLESFHGYHRRFESVAGCARLKVLALQQARGADLATLAGPIEYLELIDAKALRTLPVFRQPEHLTLLWILGSRELSLSGISENVNLQTVSLESCGQVTDADELLKLPHLAEVGLIGCREIHPRDELLKLQGCEISVLGRNPFDSEFRERAKAAPSSWNYYGSARKPTR